MSRPLAPVPDHVPPHLVVPFDYMNPPGPPNDPHRAWMRLHDGPDIIYTPYNGGHWLPTRAEDIQEVFRHTERFGGYPNTIPKELGSREYPAPPLGVNSAAEHAPFRRVMAARLSPRVVASMEDFIRRLAIDLIERFRARGRCEFVSEFAARYPIEIFLGLIGVPLEQRDVLVPLAETRMRDPDFNAQLGAIEKLFGFIHEVFEERRARPGEDLFSAIVHMDVDGRPISHSELMGMGLTILLGGLDTVMSALSFMTRFLAENPAHRRQLLEDPALIPAARDEMLRRFAAPNLTRCVQYDFNYKGVPFRKGDMVLVATCLQGLDARRFPDPLRVDFHRADDLQYFSTFGGGIHRCVGVYLASAELRIFLEEWLRRIPDFAIEPGSEVQACSGSVMCVTRLPLAWAA
ncbi:MAG: cytochrome P450 [Gammaproteobacteria bacterium]